MPDLENFDILNSTPPLLYGESAEQFERLRAELEQEIKPKGIIEKIYLNDVSALVWEILRLRRLKTNIIRNARLAALEIILVRIDPVLALGIGVSLTSEAKKLAAAWFENSDDKQFVQELLRKAQLDESAIDAEAFRRVFSDVQQLDNMLNSMEKRFSKTLRRIAEYRKSLALQIQSKADQILVRNDVPRLEPANDRCAV
jgi:hypothetical protein